MAGNIQRSPNTGSSLGYLSGENKTSTSLSTNMLITVNGVPVGAIQELSISERREVAKIQEVGTDGFIDSLPKSSLDVSGSCTTIRYDALRLTEAFGRSFLHLSSQVYPFDIVIIDKNRRDGNKISTVIKNVWFTSLSYSLSQGDWLIQDKADWTAETIYSFLSGNGASAATGGDKGIIGSGPFNTADVSDIERVVDTGKNGRRGSLDSGGLLDLVDFSTNVF